MTDSVKICLLGVACAILCTIIRYYRAEFVSPARLAGLLAVFSLLAILLSPTVEAIKTLASAEMPFEYLEIVLKALSVAFVTQISGELCRDCGEGSIALGIEAAGKLEIVLLSLPLVNKIIEISEELALW